MGLSSHQSEKLEESLEILTKKDRLIIKGSAGVGKTFMVNELIKRLSLRLGKDATIFCSAPTNKAVAVVKGKVDERENLEFTTVHSALKIKRNVNYRTGAITFKPYFSAKYPPLKGVKLFIIDEASMLNTVLLKYVEEHASNNNCITIFIGDSKQLNPVGEDISPVFTAGYPEVELTEIVRQGEGNPIITLSRNLKAVITKENQRVDDAGYIFSHSQAQVVSTLAEVNGTDDLKYIAWTNKEVDTINRLVRIELYGSNPNKVEVDETLVFNSPYSEEYYTNQEIKVDTVEVKKRTFKYPAGKQKSLFEKLTTYKPILLKYYSVNGRTNVETGLPDDNIIIVHEDSQVEFDKLLKNLASMCSARIIDWTDFYAFKESFADMKYNHAITVHKSQGSSYKQTIVNVGNLCLNKNLNEREKLLYTAITRASKLLILYKVK